MARDWKVYDNGYRFDVKKPLEPTTHTGGHGPGIWSFVPKKSPDKKIKMFFLPCGFSLSEGKCKKLFDAMPCPGDESYEGTEDMELYDFLKRVVEEDYVWEE